MLFDNNILKNLKYSKLFEESVNRPNTKLDENLVRNYVTSFLLFPRHEFYSRSFSFVHRG